MYQYQIISKFIAEKLSKQANNIKFQKNFFVTAESDVKSIICPSFNNKAEKLTDLLYAAF